MPPFAGDIGARAGSLKWTAQIPRKAHRWSLGSGSKCCDGVSNVEAGLRERSFIMPPPRQKRLEQLRIWRRRERPRKKKKQFGCGIQFCWFALQSFVTRWGGVDQKLRIRLLSIKICPWTHCEGGAMQNSTRKARFYISLTPLQTTTNKQNMVLVLFWGFSSLYKRYSKDYKSYWY